MKFIKLNGKTISKNLLKYKIDWDKSSKSKGQFALKQFLKEYWLTDLVYEEMTVPGTLLKIDFFNATKMVAFEFDGIQHETFNAHFHKNRLGYLNSIKRDVKKEKFLEINNIKLIRLNDEDLKLLSYDYLVENFEVYI